MKKVLVNYASLGRENYLAAQKRLIEATKKIDWDGDYLFYSTFPRVWDTVDIKLPNFRSHLSVPYSFKVDAVENAFDLGYSQIAWLDSTIVPLKNLNPLFEIAKTRGVVAFHNLGHALHKYIHDFAADKLEILYNPEFKEIKQIMACAVIFDLNNEIGYRVFQQWKDYSNLSGMFEEGKSDRAEFITHKHDQAILSALLYKAGVELLPYGNLVYSPHEKTLEYGSDIYFHNKGI